MKTYVGALLAGMLTGLVLYLGFTLLSDEALPFLETPYYLVVLPLFLLFLYIPVFKEKIVHSGGKKPVVVFLTFAVFSILNICLCPFYFLFFPACFLFHQSDSA